MIFQVSHNRVSEADPMRPTVVVTVYPLLITVKSKPGYSGAGGETRTHVGFPTAYKTVAIAAMRLQRLINNCSVAPTPGIEPGFKD